MLIELHGFENRRTPEFVVREHAEVATHFVTCLRIIVRDQGRIVLK